MGPTPSSPAGAGGGGGGRSRSTSHLLSLSGLDPAFVPASLATPGLTAAAGGAGGGEQSTSGGTPFPTSASSAHLSTPNPTSSSSSTTTSQPAAASTSTSTTTPSGSSTQHRIRLVPHLEATRSLHFEPIERDVREGGEAIKMGRFTDRSAASASASASAAAASSSSAAASGSGAGASGSGNGHGSVGGTVIGASGSGAGSAAGSALGAGVEAGGSTLTASGAGTGGGGADAMDVTEDSAAAQAAQSQGQGEGGAASIPGSNSASYIAGGRASARGSTLLSPGASGSGAGSGSGSGSGSGGVPGLRGGAIPNSAIAGGGPGRVDTARVAFKSKVVSRSHAEFWCEAGGNVSRPLIPSAEHLSCHMAAWAGKDWLTPPLLSLSPPFPLSYVRRPQFFLRDTGSSSGTFLNHIRLSGPNKESKPSPIKDGDVIQLGVDFKGGEEEIYRCVKMRVELNRGWQRAANQYNVNALRQLRALQGTPLLPPTPAAAAGAPSAATAKEGELPTNAQSVSITDCCICELLLFRHASAK